MVRRLAVLAFVSLLGAVPAAAQTGAKPVDHDASSKLIGLWEGSFTTPHGPGGMRLEIGRDTAWKVTVDLVIDQPIPSPVSKFVADGTTATWKLALMGQSCSSSAKLDGTILKGEIACDQGAFPFELRKR